jgi:hypothetical protein
MSAIINAFEGNKRLADRAIEQLPDDKLRIPLDANTNSIAPTRQKNKGQKNKGQKRTHRLRQYAILDSYSKCAVLAPVILIFLSLIFLSDFISQHLGSHDSNAESS